MTDTVLDHAVDGRLRPIVDKVLELYGITREVLELGSGRGPVEARSTYCWLTLQLGLNVTMQEIAEYIGGSTKTLVVQGVERIEKLRQTDKWLRESTDRILAELRA